MNQTLEDVYLSSWFKLLATTKSFKIDQTSKTVLLIRDILYIQNCKYVKSKRMRKIYHVNDKKSGVAVLLSEKVDWELQSITMDK